MHYYHFKISNRRIEKITGKVSEIPEDFKGYEQSFDETVYYKIEGGDISEVISPGEDSNEATNRVHSVIANIEK